MIRRALLAAGCLIPALMLAQQPAAQRTCNLELYNYDSTTTFGTKLPSGQYNYWYGRGVRGKCINTDQKLAGDSLELMGEFKTYTLIGHGHYEETRVRMDADRITYFQLEERVLAEGNVVAVTDKGTTLRGPRAEYFRATPTNRNVSRLYATGRPVTRISPQDAGGNGQDTVEVVADHINDVADSAFYAGGSVVITRPDIIANSDSATMDAGREWARLDGRPRIEGRGESKFTLVGRRIDLWSKDRRLTRVLSADSAVATSEDVRLASDTIDMRLNEQKVERAYAWGRSRAKAHATDRDIVSDSIDVLMPGQLLRELRAVRKAFANSKTDSTKFKSSEDDWLKGDTIIASFDSVKTAADSAPKPQIKVIVASGDAASFYQVASSQGVKAAPNLNYVTGKAITVNFGADKSVSTVAVREKAAGVYLELAPDSIAADSAKAARAKAAADSVAAGKGGAPRPATPAPSKGTAAPTSTKPKKP